MRRIATLAAGALAWTGLVGTSPTLGVRLGAEAREHSRYDGIGVMLRPPPTNAAACSAISCSTTTSRGG